MHNLRGIFESKLPDANLAWRGDDGQYVNAYVQRAWEMVQAVEQAKGFGSCADMVAAKGAAQIRTEIKEALFLRMNKLGWTQAKFAATCGCTAADISRLMNGKGNVSIERLADMLQALNSRT